MLQNTIRRSAMTVAGLGALGLGGAAIADATSRATGSKTSSAGTRQARPRRQQQALSGDVASKVKAAALAKVPGATARSSRST